VKIYIGMIAYNEEIFIEAALRSTYDYVDEIIVVDGSPWGVSTDKTVTIAKSVGDKVRVISGIFENPKDKDHKKIQRQCYIDSMEKGGDNWCILQDADEVWKNEDIRQLIEYLRNADGKTLLVSTRHINFWRDCWHTVNGGNWDLARPVGSFRLVPGIAQLNHHRVGIGGKSFDNSVNRVTLDDIKFYHYGHASTYEKFLSRKKLYFDRDKHIRDQYGYEEGGWEKFLKEKVIPEWEAGFDVSGSLILEYKGEHPDAVKPLIGTFWPGR